VAGPERTPSTHERGPGSARPGSREPGRCQQPAISRGRQARTTISRPLAYYIDEAARLAGLSRDLLYDQMRHGNLTYVKVGRRRLITRHHLQQFLGDAPT
jgi:excisionase family DNA binding protein